MKVGFIGLGAMGVPMVRNLMKAGHAVTVTSRGRPPIDRMVLEGAVDGGSHAGVVDASDVTILSVPFSPDVALVIESAGPAIGPGKTIVNCSTIEPSAEVEFHRRVAATGAAYLEAPVSGGPEVAAAASLAIMTGGEEPVLETAKPALQSLSRIIVHMGGPGSGQAAKMCNNLIHVAQNLGVAEAIALALNARIDIGNLRKVILHSTGDCTAVRNRIPVPGVVADSPASNGWKGFPIEMMIKELDMIIAFGSQNGLPTVSSAIYRGLLLSAEEAGFGKEDFSAVGKLLQDPTRHSAVHRWLNFLAAATDQTAHDR